MCHHAMIGSHRKPLNVPGANHGFASCRVSESSRCPKSFHHSRQLSYGRNVHNHYATRHERVGDVVDALPRSQHVENDAIGALWADNAGQARVKVTHRERPVFWGVTKECLNIGSSDLSELVASLK